MNKLHIPHYPCYRKTANGWSAMITGITDDFISGKIHIQLSKDKTHYMDMVWDRYGYPIDITKNPSKYYIRLK